MHKDHIKNSLLVIFLFVGILISFKPAMLVLMQWVAKKHFVMDRLSVGSLEFRSYKEIAFEGIRAEKDGGLVFEAQEISLRFFSNSTKNILKVVIKSALLDIKQPDKNALDFIRMDFLDAPKKSLLSELECLGFDLKVQFKDLKFVSRFSINVNLSQQKINTLHLDISSLDYQAFHLENLLLLVKRDDVGGHLTIAKIKYDKVIIDEIQSSAHFENQNLLFDDLSAKILNGNIIGNLVVSFVVLPGYQARLQFKGLNLKRFVEDLELEKKFTMTGSLSGNISLEGQGALLKVLDGDFATDAPGGRVS